MRPLSPNCQSPQRLGAVAGGPLSWYRRRQSAIVRPKSGRGPCGACGRLPPQCCCCCRLTMLHLRREPKQGGILRIYHRDSPGSASIHEGATYSVNVPFMPVFNNLVVFDQHMAQNSVETIVPELAESWAWSGDNKTLTFKLRQGVKWHDGKPFTSADVKCTFDMLMGKSQQKFRQNPRKSWYDQVNDVTANGDYEASFNLKRPQPALLSLLASGYTPIYPCHVSPADMRTHPIGTGPFKFVEFKANESIKLAKNPGLLEEGPALSRRHRIHHHHEPLDRDPRLHRRQVRHDVPDRSVDPAAEGRQVAGAERGVRGRADQRLHQHHRQLVRRRRSTISTSAARWRWRSTARPSSRSCSRARPISAAPCCRRRAGYGRMPKEMLEIDPGLRPGHQRQPRRSAQADGRRRAMVPTSISPSRSRPATFRSTATPPSS